MPDQSTSPSLGYFSQRQELPSVTPSWVSSEERLKREDQTTTGDYVGSMVRQDGLVSGAIASAVGHNMTPDPNYSPYEANEWKSLTDGVWPEFHDEFANAHSGAHALYIKGRLLEKQQDLTRLGDLGIPGTIGRFALGAVMPENLLAAVAGGGVAGAARMSEVALAARAAASGGEAAVAAARAGAVAEAAAKAGSTGATISGIAAGGAGNAAFEKLRQSVNFEDDKTAVLEAALVGAAFTAPFAVAGSRTEARIANAANRERQALTVLAKADAGQALTPEEHAIVTDVAAQHERIKAVEEGHASPEEASNWKHTEDKQWLDELHSDLRSRAEQMLDDMFPDRVTRRTMGQFLPEGEPLKLGYDPTVRDGNAPIQVTPDGTAIPGASTRADVEAAIRDAAQKKFPKDPAKAEQWAMEQRAGSLGYTDEVATKVSAAKAEKASPKTPEEVLTGDRPAEAPASPVEAPEKAAPAEPTAAAPEVPKGPREGSAVEFTTRSGDTNWGVIEKAREDGFLHIRDEEGKEHVVHSSRLQDQPPPSGFGPDSIGAARVASPAAGHETNLTRFSKARLDIFAVLNRSKSDTLRKLAYMLVKDPIQNDAALAQGMTASEWKSQLKRTVGGIFHMDARDAAREAAQKMGVPMWKRGAFFHEFYGMVSRLTRGDLSVKVGNPDIAPMLERASKAQREVYAQMLHEMKEAGVKGAEHLEPNDFYVNRVWSHRGIREAIEKHGEDAVHRLLATSINVPGFVGDVGKAKTFLNTVRKLEFSKALADAHLYAEDMGTLRNELARAGLRQDEIDLLVDTMFKAQETAGSDKGRAAPMKYRFDINETLSANTPAGKLRISDLFENDARVLVDSYLNSMGGHVGLAKHGIESQDAFTSLIRKAEQEAVDKNVDISSDLKLAQDVYNNIVGRPMSTQDFSNTARLAAAMRGYARSANLGQLGIAAAFEMKQAIGLMGFRSFWEHMPTFRQMVTGMRNGYLPDKQLARDLEHLVGFGSEMAASYSRAHEIDEGFLGQQLSRIEAGANHASHAVDIISGNASFTSITRQLSSMMGTQRLYDFATGLKKLTPKMRERLVGWGVDDHQIEAMLESMKDHTTAGKGGKVEGIDYENWLQNDPGRYHQFQTVLSRMVRDAIQDHDIGETMPFMHSTLGKVFGELKSFFLVAHAKNMLKNASYMDATALQVYLIGFLGEALGYSTQASMNYAHDPQKMREMLSPTNIGLAAFARSPVNGFLPYLAESTYGTVTGGKGLFGPDMTANTGNRTLVPPSLIALQRLYAAPSTAFGLLRGSDQVTRQEGLDLFKTLPLSNMYGARNLGNWLTQSLPAQEPRKGL